MTISREAALGVAASLLAVGAMAVDHLIGKSDPGENDSFPVDTPGFVLTSVLSIAVAIALFRFVVRRAATNEARRLARKALIVGVLAIVTIPLLFAGVTFPIAGAAIALGLMTRASGRQRAGAAAVILGTLVLVLGVGVYLDALVRR